MSAANWRCESPSSAFALIAERSPASRRDSASGEIPRDEAASEVETELRGAGVDSVVARFNSASFELGLPNGHAPLNSSYRMTPSENTSSATEERSPRNCAGLE